jgi:glycosyltransferase involved in cell wall biosynthesis
MESLPQKVSGQPLVSIITIVFNGEAGIRQTMDSVLCQDYESVEYIVIDGGSTDGTVAILNEYDSQLTCWKSESDKGISDAFNKGIKAAQGEIIGLINAGDWYEPDAVQCAVDVFTADTEIGVVCGALQFWKGAKREYLCRSVPELLEREMSVTHPTCFVRADLYDQVGLFSNEYKLAMDYELLLRIKRHGAQFVSLDRVLANMQHDGISEENWKAALRETHRARTELLDSSFFTTIWYCYFLSFKRWIRIVIERLGWDGLLRLYRNRIALVRKTK